MSDAETLAAKPAGKDFENNENYQMVNLLRRLQVSEQKPDSFSAGAGASASLAAASRASKPRESTPQPASPAQASPQTATSQAFTARSSAPQAASSRLSASQAASSRGPALNPVKIDSPKLAPDPVGSAELAKEVFNHAPKETHASRPAPREASRPSAKAEAAKTDAQRHAGKILMLSQSPSRDPVQDSPKNSETVASVSEKSEKMDKLEKPEIAENPIKSDPPEKSQKPEKPVRPPSRFGKRRLAAVAAVITLAAVGGGLATARVEKYLGQFKNVTRSNGGDETQTASVANQAVDEAIARIDAELASLKELSAAESAKLNDRIDKLEKAQAQAQFDPEPATKPAEATERPRATSPLPAAVATLAPPRDALGALRPPARVPLPKPDVARLPNVTNWSLRDVANGGAVIEGRQGLLEVFAGDTVPGVGRVEAIKRQGNRWVIVTPKGLIVPRQ
jgi:hypothetical protein